MIAVARNVLFIQGWWSRQLLPFVLHLVQYPWLPQYLVQSVSLELDLEQKIKECTAKCDEQPSQENLSDLEILKTEYDSQYDYIAQGAIIRSRVNWYEYGEKSNKYFLNLENSKKKKSCIRKLVGFNDECIMAPKQIMTEIHSFYANLYDKDSCQQGG